MTRFIRALASLAVVFALAGKVESLSPWDYKITGLEQYGAEDSMYSGYMPIDLEKNDEGAYFFWLAEMRGKTEENPGPLSLPTITFYAAFHAISFLVLHATLRPALRYALRSAPHSALHSALQSNSSIPRALCYSKLPIPLIHTFCHLLIPPLTPLHAFHPSLNLSHLSPITSCLSLSPSHSHPLTLSPSHPLTSHLSPLTSHLSPLISHLLPPISHLSNLTSHLSPLTLSPLISHLSPLTFSPLTSYPSPFTSPHR
jgi:hypothetical protein